MEISIEQAYNDALTEIGRLIMENKYLKAALSDATKSE